ncbi:MAG: hypothetical protein ACUZ8H_10350 [Candidatus Anammoxibacter sp.]
MLNKIIIITTVTVTYDDSKTERHTFTRDPDAAKFARELVSQNKEHIVSVLMEGLYGAREFL